MYLNYLINESAVINEIEENESNILEEFKKSFSTDLIYNTVYENLNNLIVKDNMVETYESIKEFSKNYTLNYLITTSKQLAQ